MPSREMPAGLDMGSANHGSGMIAYTMSSPACNTCMLHVLLSIGHCDSLEVQFSGLLNLEGLRSYSGL